MQTIKDAVEAAYQKAEAIYNRKFKRPIIKANIQFRSGIAGQAVYTNWTLRINPNLYRKYPAQMLEVTIPHEVAHLVSAEMYGKEGVGHGPRWKSVMIALGQKPDRCHKMLVPAAKTKAVYGCQNCEKQILTSRKGHFMAMNGAKFKPCKCKGEFIYLGKVWELAETGKLNLFILPAENTLVSGCQVAG